VANLSKTMHTNFYQNLSTFAKVMHKSICVFIPQVGKKCFLRPQCNWKHTCKRCIRPYHIL